MPNLYGKQSHKIKQTTSWRKLQQKQFMWIYKSGSHKWAKAINNTEKSTLEPNRYGTIRSPTGRNQRNANQTVYALCHLMHKYWKKPLPKVITMELHIVVSCWWCRETKCHL
jgi:hypothetical protein